MNLGFYNLYPKCNNNVMFASPKADIGDDMFYPMWHLATTLKKLGHGVATIDTAPLETFDAVVFMDYPMPMDPWFRRVLKRGDKPMYLMMIESRAVWRRNWDLSKHGPFRKVLTWSPDLVDDKKYVRMHMSQKLPEFEPYAPSRADKFCCLISSQKYSSDPAELYTERVRAIRWFEKNHPGEFDLYGQRWDRFYFQTHPVLNIFLAQFYSRCPWLPRRQVFPSYRGSVKSKKDTMRQYKFAICYENSAEPGWLTEKMLDSMFAGTVPIYDGDPYATKIVPPAAFVDKRNFANYDELYRFLKGMSQTEYEGYRQAAHQFIHGEAIKPLGVEWFTQMMIREVVNDGPNR